MAPTSWLTVSAAATRLGCQVEDVQRMVDAEILHGQWIHDHLSISEDSVQDRIVWADNLATKYRTTAVFIHRLAAYARRRSVGDDVWGAAVAIGADPFVSADRYERWFAQLGAELIPGALAADLEDAMSAYLSRGEPPIVSLPAPIADPVERYERLLEWADDRTDDERGDDE